MLPRSQTHPELMLALHLMVLRNNTSVFVDARKKNSLQTQ